LDLDKAVYPITILPLLKSMDYQVDVDTAVGRSDKMLFLKELKEVLQMRYNLYKKLEKEEKWDLFFFIITGTDRLHHFLFDASACPDSPYYKGFLDYYQMVDQIIGEITKDMEKRGIPFIILSDHGFVKTNKEVYISQYLKEWGYLDLENEKPKNLKSMTEKTKIFTLDPSRLYIHLEGEYSKGSVKEEDYQKLREEIKEKFLVLEIDGEKVIKQVFYKEEIYNGKYLDHAPDLVLLSNYGFDLKSGVTKSSHYDKTLFEGMHSWDNAMLIDSYGFDLNGHPYIYDIGKKLKEFF
jgi:predicted AlkP superfamily phosphohydrolase/phosphomutase